MLFGGAASRVADAQVSPTAAMNQGNMEAIGTPEELFASCRIAGPLSARIAAGPRTVDGGGDGWL